jgi:hypothetical protein
VFFHKTGAMRNTKKTNYQEKSYRKSAAKAID